jgi:hypothetical protein
MRRLTAIAAAAVLLAVGYAASAPGQLGEAARATTAPTPPQDEDMPVTSDRALKAVVGDEGEGDGAIAVPNGHGPHLSAQVLRRTNLHVSPGGPIVVDIGHRTRFGGPQIVAVVARRGRWLGVLHQWMTNGKTGWILARDAQLLRQRYAIEVDRSDRRAVVRLDGDVVRRIVVGIGNPGSPTPTGRFAVTDRLAAGAGSPYGCCILALSGTQPNLPQGWEGGDRLALHGSADDHAGGAVSAGCLNLRERDLRWLMKRIPVGARVTIRT